jgi:hypothetical protein
MYLRFAISEIDKDSNRQLGIFHAAGDLRDSGRLHEYEADALYELRAWFNENLEKPTRFTASKTPPSPISKKFAR